MSDFLFTTSPHQASKLAEAIRSIYAEDAPSIHQWEGAWGSLAVSETLYHGFSVFEDDEAICVVIGGPVLYFRDNTFLTQPPSATATKAIADRVREGKICWDEDLSGPFAYFQINKHTAQTMCVTDLMAFIPVYRGQKSDGEFALGTHVDALATVCDRQEVDPVGAADFLLTSRIIHPYTYYRDIFQLSPSSIFTQAAGSTSSSTFYWTPAEQPAMPDAALGTVAAELYAGVQGYIERLTPQMDTIAQFISGGEDSRVLSGLLPKRCKRDAFVFLDSMNHEGKVAAKAAKAYGANFHCIERSRMYYLDILSGSSRLVGNGMLYANVHPYGLYRQCRLRDYPAVFGGYLSDSLLKGNYIRKKRQLVLLLREQKHAEGDAIDVPHASVLRPEILEALRSRYNSRFQDIRTLRKESAHEWFHLWPVSMCKGTPNIHGNRRLFRSYEVFLCKEAVKTAAAVPQQWKFNGKLFHKAFQTTLRPTRMLMHSDGRLPYFPWYISNIGKIICRIVDKTSTRLGLNRGNQGPWGDWDYLQRSNKWQEIEQNALTAAEPLLDSISPDTDALLKFIHSEQASQMQRINFLQLISSQKRHTDHEAKA